MKQSNAINAPRCLESCYDGVTGAYKGMAKVNCGSAILPKVVCFDCQSPHFSWIRSSRQQIGHAVAVTAASQYRCAKGNSTRGVTVTFGWQAFTLVRLKRATDSGQVRAQVSLLFLSVRQEIQLSSSASLFPGELLP